MRLILGAILLLLGSPVLAFDLKGVTLGAPAKPADVEQRFGRPSAYRGVNIFSLKCGLGDHNWQVCNGGTTVADIPGRMNLVIDDHGIVQRMNFTFPTVGFAQVKDALLTKLGNAAVHQHVKDQNRMGATFDDEFFLWKNAAGDNVLLKQYNGSLDESLLSFTTEADRDAMASVTKGHTGDL